MSLTAVFPAAAITRDMRKVQPLWYSEICVARLADKIAEVCALLSISGKILRRLEQRGLLKPRCALRTKHYPQTEVERFLREPLRPQSP